MYLLGVPQGSILGPFLIKMETLPLVQIMKYTKYVTILRR